MISWAIDPITGGITKADAKWKSGWNSINGGGSSSGSGSGASGSGYVNGLRKREQSDQALAELSGTQTNLDEQKAALQNLSTNGILTPDQKAQILGDARLKNLDLVRANAESAYRGSGGAGSAPDPFLSARVSSAGVAAAGKAYSAESGDLEKYNADSRLQGLNMLSGLDNQYANLNKQRADILSNTETEEDYQKRLDQQSKVSSAAKFNGIGFYR